MKKVLTKLWSGLCQAMSLLGYKKEGKFSKWIWRLFATSITIIIAVYALIFVCVLGKEAYEWFSKRYFGCDDPDCWAITHISRDIYFHDHEDGKGYVFNMRTGEKLIKHIAWIVEPNGKDTLVCFSNGQKRGYFSENTGKVVIEPQYGHAWIFSEGLASVEEGGYIKFIDGTGKVVIDNKIIYNPDMDECVFHGGYCVVASDDGEFYGLMDKTGKMVLGKEYDSIDPSDDYELWSVEKGKEMAVYDKNMRLIIPFTECSIYIDEGTIDMTLPNHTMRKYNMEGNLIHDFYINSVRTLEFEKEEILYRTRTHDDDGSEYAVPFVESYHPNATARLRAYVAGYGYEGLMTADGHVVTMPLYRNIEAIGHDLYLCEVSNSDKVIVNGSGEIVR